MEDLLDAAFERRPDVVLREVGPWRLLVPVRAGLPDDVSLLVLDGPVAELVWGALDGCRTGREIGQELLTEFDVEPARALEELAVFLRQLVAVGAIRRAR